MGADFLAGFVGVAVFGDGVVEGFGAAGVHVRAAGFGAEVSGVGWSGERNGLGFGDGLGAADCDGCVGETGGFSDCCSVDKFCGRGGCEAEERGRGGGDVVCHVDGGDRSRSSDVQARASTCEGRVVERRKQFKSAGNASRTCDLTLLTLASCAGTRGGVCRDGRCDACCRDDRSV